MLASGRGLLCPVGLVRRTLALVCLGSHHRALLGRTLILPPAVVARMGVVALSRRRVRQ